MQRWLICLQQLHASVLTFLAACCVSEKMHTCRLWLTTSCWLQNYTDDAMTQNEEAPADQAPEKAEHKDDDKDKDEDEE